MSSVWKHETFKSNLTDYTVSTTVTRLIKRRFRRSIKCVHMMIVDKESGHVTAFLHEHNGKLVY